MAPINPSKIDYDGDNVPGPGEPREARCPNGHPVQTIATVRKGQGRLRCTVCNWNDAQTVTATEPQDAPAPSTQLRDLRERPHGVQILGAPAGGAEIFRG